MIGIDFASRRAATMRALITGIWQRSFSRVFFLMYLITKEPPTFVAPDANVHEKTGQGRAFLGNGIGSNWAEGSRMGTRNGVGMGGQPKPAKAGATSAAKDNRVHHSTGKRSD